MGPRLQFYVRPVLIFGSLRLSGADLIVLLCGKLLEVGHDQSSGIFVRRR